MFCPPSDSYGDFWGARSSVRVIELITGEFIMIASVARLRINSARVAGVAGLLTIAVAVALMAYAAPARARGQVQPAHGQVQHVAPGIVRVDADLIHRGPAVGIPAWRPAAGIAPRGVRP